MQQRRQGRRQWRREQGVAAHREDVSKVRPTSCLASSGWGGAAGSRGAGCLPLGRHKVSDCAHSLLLCAVDLVWQSGPRLHGPSASGGEAWPPPASCEQQISQRDPKAEGSTTARVCQKLGELPPHCRNGAEQAPALPLKASHAGAKPPGARLLHVQPCEGK